MHAVVSDFEIALAMNVPPPPPGAPALPPPRCARRSPAVTAGVTLALAALGAAAYLAMRPDRPARALSTAEQLDASAAAVAARHPEMRLDVTPLTKAELEALEAPRCAQCSVVILEPVGVSVSDRPSIRWRGNPRAKAYEVNVYARGVHVKVRTEGDSITYPARADPLPVGVACTLEIYGEIRAEFATDPTDYLEARQEFTVLSVPKRSAWRTLVGDVESNEPASIRDLLLLHAALRLGMLGEALHRADAFATAAANPRDEAARPVIATLARLVRLDDR